MWKFREKNARTRRLNRTVNEQREEFGESGLSAKHNLPLANAIAPRGNYNRYWLAEGRLARTNT